MYAPFLSSSSTFKLKKLKTVPPINLPINYQLPGESLMGPAENCRRSKNITISSGMKKNLTFPSRLKGIPEKILILENHALPTVAVGGGAIFWESFPPKLTHFEHQQSYDRK